MQDTSLNSIFIKHPDSIGGRVIPPFSYIHAEMDSVPTILEENSSIDSLISNTIKADVADILAERFAKENTEKIFVPSILKTEKIEEEIFFFKTPKSDYTFAGISFLIGLFLWSFFRFIDKDGWLEFIDSIKGGSTLKESLRNEKVYTSPFPLKFAFLGHILFALFASVGLHSNGFIEGWSDFIFVFGVALLISLIVFVSKVTLVTLGGSVFDIKQNAAVHNYFLFISHLLMSIILFVSIAAMIIDSKNSPLVIHIFSAVIVGLSSIYVIAQCLVNFSYKNRSHYFYILLYLCTLEVLPLVTLGGYLITKT